MNVLLQMADPAADKWRRALAASLPEATIAVWPEPLAPVDYALVWKPPAAVFDAVRPTKALFNLGAGVDALLAVPTLPIDVPVVRLEDAGMAVQMAEYATLAVLAAYREQREYASSQREARWAPRRRIPKDGYGIGLLGFGVLGQAVAAALAPFGFPLAAWSRGRKTAPGVASFAGDAELPAFLARTRVLICLLPSTPHTRDLLDRRTLAQLPAGAHVVNVARGDIVVDADLVALLDEGHLASATLDVFRREPLSPEHPFWHHPRISLTPHVSALTRIDDSVAQVAAKIRRIERGEPVTGVVDRARGY